MTNHVAGDRWEPQHGRGVRPQHPGQEHQGRQEEGESRVKLIRKIDNLQKNVPFVFVDTPGVTYILRNVLLLTWWLPM